MLTLISPAKTMESKARRDINSSSLPRFQDEANFLASKIALLPKVKLQKMLKMSDKLTESTFEQYSHFGDSKNQLIPSILAYNGTVFKEIKVMEYSQDDFDYLQNHLVIISVLYGLLRPLDMIENYRAEYKMKILGDKEGDLYKFWQPKLTNQLIEDVKKRGGVMVNLGSLDLQPALDMKLLRESVSVITPEFKELRSGKWATIRTYAKVARGSMTNFIIKNRIEDPIELKKFTFREYSYNSELSTEDNYIYTV